jgi:uncharacterized RDD family membrane protein YckC
MTACPNCAKANEDHALFCQGCGTALKSSVPLTMPEVASGKSYGGFWKRTLAWLIDSIVVSVGVGAIMMVTLGLGFIAIPFGHWLYEALMLSSSWQATLGKRALGMVVTDLQGERLSFGRATGRHFAKWISYLVLGIGYIMAAFTAKKQGLHDLVAGTLVVNE